MTKQARKTQEIVDQNRRVEIMWLARDLLPYMVAGNAEAFSDARVASVVSAAFKIATEWRDYTDALDKVAEERSKEDLHDDLEGNYGVV